MDYFRSYNREMKEKFGCRIYKVSIDGGFSCPNRDGTKGKCGCIFCDETGSSSRTHTLQTPIKEQVKKNIRIRRTRYKAKKFIAYFQSYTNTYAPIEVLKEKYDEAIETDPDIIGLTISTRPDCINEENVKLIASYQQRLPYVSIELGLQSIHNETLKKINRQETFEDFLNAIQLIQKYKLHHCVHVILGLPGETPDMMIETAKMLSHLKVEGVKIHTLIAMENTPLATMYDKKIWKPFDFEENIERICDFIEHLDEKIIIHRISGNGHPQYLKAPLWIKEKKRLIKPSLNEMFHQRGTRQGAKC